MENNELRIGNFVYNQNGDMKGTPIGVPFKIQTGQDISWGDLYVPIPLIEEWLVKFGFRKQDADHIYLFPKNDSLRMWGFAWSVQNWVFPHEWIDINTPSIQYVHQLQNLYFALTGTELEIK